MDPGSGRAFGFKSDRFNTTIERESFINPGCFGDDVACWLIAELRSKGFDTVEQPSPEDFGWYFQYKVAGVEHEVVIFFVPGDVQAEGEWICRIERKSGLVGSLVGRRKHALPAAIDVIYRILSSGPAVAGLRSCSDAEFK